MMQLKRGFIQVYTGNGKGKTTAAIGLAIRALGAGMNVYMAQFMKDYEYSELKILKNLGKNLILERFGNDRFVFNKEEPNIDLKSQMKQGLDHAREAIMGLEYDLVILDEVLVSIYYRLFSEQEIISLIKNKPEKVELVLTGRYCPSLIIELADLVTTMEETKHYYQNGILARPGIEA